MAQTDHITSKVIPVSGGAETEIQINLAPEPVFVVTMLHWFSLGQSPCHSLP